MNAGEISRRDLHTARELWGTTAHIVLSQYVWGGFLCSKDNWHIQNILTTSHSKDCTPSILGFRKVRYPWSIGWVVSSAIHDCYVSLDLNSFLLNPGYISLFSYLSPPLQLPSSFQNAGIFRTHQAVSDSISLPRDSKEIQDQCIQDCKKMSTYSLQSYPKDQPRPEPNHLLDTSGSKKEHDHRQCYMSCCILTRVLI